MTEKSSISIGFARINKLFSQNGPNMLSRTKRSKALSGPISTQHIVNFPNRIKQKDPSDGVIIRALGTKAEEPKDVLPRLEPRGDISDRFVEKVATPKVLQTVTGLGVSAEPTANRFAKPGASGPTVTPSPHKTREVFRVNNFSHLA